MAFSHRQLLLLLLGLLVAAPAARVAAEEYDEEYYEGEEEGEGDEGGDASDDDVVVLTEKNFDKVVNEHKFVLVEFYAPWCGHCKALAPEYAKAATALKNYDQDVVIAKVDATVESELAKKFDVSGYPTLKWFVDGEVGAYGGGRDMKTIVAWIKKKTGPPAVTAVSVADVEKVASDGPVLVLGYFEKFEGAAYDAFQAYASKTDGLVIVQTASKEVATSMSLSSFGIAVKKSFDFEEASTKASDRELTSESEVSDFISAAKLPLFIPFSQSNADLIFESGLEGQIMFIGDTDSLDGETFAPFKKVAEEFAGKLVFVTVNSDEKDAEPVIEFFGIAAGAEFPVIMGFSIAGGGGKKYRPEGEYSLETLQAFAQAMIDGTAKPIYKSAAIPGNPKDGDVTIVVGKNFDEIVKAEDKDVLLEVYAPWCGHCKQLEPIYKKLAKRFKKIDSVVIAKMDGTENEHAEVEVEGFPTIIFFPAGGKDPVPMDGERTLAGMTKFIKTHATIPYELPKKAEKDTTEDGHDEL